MHPKHQRRPFADRRRVVRGARPVGRPHLAQDGAGLTHHVGGSGSRRRFHQLAARDDHLAAVRERRQHQQDRRGVVVHPTAASAPVSCVSSVAACTVREPRVPAATSYSRLVSPRPPPRCVRSAAPASGARPRLVWTMTPVALTTDRSRRRDAARRRGSRRSRMMSAAASGSVGASFGQQPIRRSPGRFLHRRVRRSRGRPNRRSAARATPQSHGGSPRASPRDP